MERQNAGTSIDDLTDKDVHSWWYCPMLQLKLRLQDDRVGLTRAIHRLNNKSHIK